MRCPRWVRRTSEGRLRARARPLRSLRLAPPPKLLGEVCFPPESVDFLRAGAAPYLPRGEACAPTEGSRRPNRGADPGAWSAAQGKANEILRSRAGGCVGSSFA